MPVSREDLFRLLTERGLNPTLPANADAKWVRQYENLEGQRGVDGRLHPTYRVLDSGRPAMYPNLMVCRIDHFQAAPGKIILPISPAKFESVYLCTVLGEKGLAKELADTEDTLGAFFLSKFGMPVTKESSFYMKAVFFGGLYGKSNPDVVDKHEGEVPQVPLWTDLVRRWPGLKPKAQEDQKAVIRKAWTMITNLLLDVAVEYEDRFPGTLTGIWMDTMIIECDFMVKDAIETWLTDKFTEKSGNKHRMFIFGHAPRPKPGTTLTKMQLLFED